VRAPRLRQAVQDAKKAEYAYVVLDGTLISIDQVARTGPFYSGKHKKHGLDGNAQASAAVILISRQRSVGSKLSPPDQSH
jgi:hypothetical protein